MNLDVICKKGLNLFYKTQKMINLEHIVWKEEQHFVAQCLNVDVSSFGGTKEEAFSNLKEALELYFEDTNLNDIQKIEQPEIIHDTFSHA